ncbi:archaemetzincin-2 [Echinops telfairi]|uniref:Archaemetzincin-2 n=1 Tax=Echinops telfairi TaxID=9371 RepID=A0AC55DVK7_ECHTE|nr:archaemetzincin-2 [Echinops telfairi]
MIDLYPRDSWNFVFGQASLTDGVGIFSFARYSNDFYSECFKGKGQKPVVSSSSDYSVFDNYCVPEITGVLLLRSCKEKAEAFCPCTELLFQKPNGRSYCESHSTATLTHEIGHIFGMRHCQWLSCLMQGSNHLEEADRRPPHLCPICLRKLQSAIGFHIADRYHALLRWIEEEPADVLGRTPKPACEEAGNWPDGMAAFKEWKEWIVRCLAVLQKEGPSDRSN